MSCDHDLQITQGGTQADKNNNPVAGSLETKSDVSVTSGPVTS